MHKIALYVAYSTFTMQQQQCSSSKPTDKEMQFTSGYFETCQYYLASSQYTTMQIIKLCE